MGKTKAKERDFLLFPFPSTPAPAARVSRRRLGTSQVLNYLTPADLLMGGFGFTLDSYGPSEIDLIFATLLSNIVARLRRIAFKFGNFTIIKALFPVVSTTFP